MCDRNAMLLLAGTAVALWMTGCGKLGSVEQGRVIAYNRTSGQVTLILDSSGGRAAAPVYDALPPVLVQSPADPDEMGPAPQPGKLMRVDLKKREMTVYDAVARQFRTIRYTLVSERQGVAKGAGFPAVDPAKRTISVYWAPAHTVVTIAASAELLAMPLGTWRAGDEVRYYFKDPGQALRMMNVTRTDLNKG